MHDSSQKKHEDAKSYRITVKKIEELACFQVNFGYSKREGIAEKTSRSKLTYRINFYDSEPV